MAKAPDGFFILKEIDALIRQSENAVSKGLQDISKDLVGKINRELVRLLDIQNGAIIPSVDNMKSIAGLRKMLDTFFKSKGYIASVRQATNNYSDIEEQVTEYFTLVDPAFKASAEFAKKTIDFYKSQTVELLAGEGLNANFKSQLEKLIFDGIENGEPLASLEKRTRAFLTEESGSLARYGKQVTTDTLNTFSRSYTNGIADDLGLEHYYYSGTEIKTTRSFCDHRIGKYYTQKEVEAWSKLKWQGKKKGTNKDTIFTFLGGYNCRHKLLPVTETMYNKNK